MNTAIPAGELEELVVPTDGHSDTEIVDAEKDLVPARRLPYSDDGKPERAVARERTRGDAPVDRVRAEALFDALTADVARTVAEEARRRAGRAA